MLERHSSLPARRALRLICPVRSRLQPSSARAAPSSPRTSPGMELTGDYLAEAACGSAACGAPLATLHGGLMCIM